MNIWDEDNILTLTDFYKPSHWKQYKERTQKVYSYLEARKDTFADSTLVFGPQFIIKKYLVGKVVTQERIDQAEKIINASMGPGIFNRAGWEHILRKHDGMLPLRIKSVPEGTLIPNHNVLLTVENTDVECYWLTNYVESLLVQAWYPCTVATLSFKMKELILSYLERTGDPELVDFKLHDFGFRGVSSVESAGIGGAAHLVNFKGTDTIPAVLVAHNYYGAVETPGFSIPAAEHSTVTSWGGPAGETDAFRNMLQQFPTGLVAVVSDSYDIYKACSEKWGKELKAEVLSRDGTLVIRPDSGTPEQVVLKVIQTLMDSFGYDTNAKGYKVLNPKVRVIQGDGIDYETVEKILNVLEINKISADNVAFGMGGALLQRLDRDTLGFAFKCSSVVIDSIEKEVYKSPITDPGKKSKRGRLELHKNAAGDIETVRQGATPHDDMLEIKFWDGELHNEQTFEDIRARAKAELTQPLAKV